jgi:hypothetical protein
MIYKVKVVEEIRYHITYEVEADSEDEAKDLVMGEIVEGDIEEQDITYYDILSVDEEHSDA